MRNWIVHLDMDAFFASIEQLDNAAYRGKPIIVGGPGDRGVVSTCSYEARRFGIHSAMPLVQARKLCPFGIFLAPRISRYKEVSAEIMNLLATYSPLVEQSSIDEAYLDFSGSLQDKHLIYQTTLSLQKTVQKQLRLSCSLGAAPVKFLAKISSDMQKPQGITILAHQEVAAFMLKLPAWKIPGVGKRTWSILESFGIRSAGDILRYPEEFWLHKLGKNGRVLYERAQGKDPRPVVPYTEAKSESAENTFADDTDNFEILSHWLLSQAERVGERLRQEKREGRTITLKLKFADFTQISRSRTLPYSTNSTKRIFETAQNLLKEQKLPQKLRLIGLGVSHFGKIPRQLSLLDLDKETQRQQEEKLEQTLDALRKKFGRKVIAWGEKIDS